MNEYFDLINTWNEENRLSLNIPDTGNSYVYLNQALAAVSGFLIQTSFTARQEVIFKVQSPRNFIELSAELYGVTDNAFDFFILTNKLTSDEIIEIPRGRIIKYYI